jgi:hypothetical protein
VDRYVDFRARKEPTHLARLANDPTGGDAILFVDLDSILLEWYFIAHGNSTPLILNGILIQIMGV